jgi:uncharacterized membrane protein YccC
MRNAAGEVHAPEKLPQRLGMLDNGIRYAIGAMTAASPTIGTAGPQAGAGAPAPQPVAEPKSWFGQLLGILVRFDKKKMQPPMALRNTMGVILPLIAGYALGMPRGGLAMASGALNASYSDGSDPYAQRAKRMLASTTWCSVAVLLGALTGHHNVLSVAIVLAWTFVAGMLVSLGTTAADVGVISTVMLVVYAAQPLTPMQAVSSALLALGGGLLQTGLSVALWPVQRYDPERRALGALFLALAKAARAPVEAAKAPVATTESLQAQNALAGLSRDENVDAVRYRSLLNQAERLRLSLTAVSRLRMRLNRQSDGHPAIEVIDRYFENTAKMLDDLGASLLSGKDLADEKDRLVLSVALAYQLREDNAGERGTFAAAVAQNARLQMDALSGQMRAALDLASRATPQGQAEFVKEEARQPLWLRFSGVLATLRGNLNLQSATLRHAVRLAACVAVGDAAGRMFESSRSYWIPMTIVLVLKPEFATTFSRGILRIAGTIAGLVLATALFHFLPIHTATEIALIAVFMFLMRWVGPANYGIFGVTVSALIVLLLTITGVAPMDVINARGLNTVIGGVLALAAYAIWPTWERTQLPELFAKLLEAYEKSFHQVTENYLRSGQAPDKERDRARQHARTARSNFETSLDRLGAEPGVTPEQMSQWNAMLASSHRFAHALMSMEAGVPHTEEAPPRPEFRQFREDVEKTLSLLAKILRGKHTAEKEFPDLREDHNRLVAAGDPGKARYALVNVEADRMTNSLNTLREQEVEWLRAGQGEK